MSGHGHSLISVTTVTFLNSERVALPRTIDMVLNMEERYIFNSLLYFPIKRCHEKHNDYPLGTNMHPCVLICTTQNLKQPKYTTNIHAVT